MVVGIRCLRAAWWERRLQAFGDHLIIVTCHSQCLSQCGAGHRETWDSLLPRSIDEIRREKIRYIDAGERHSLAISDSRQLWVWGQGVHGGYEVARPDLASTSILHPILVLLNEDDLQRSCQVAALLLNRMRMILCSFVCRWICQVFRS